MSEQLKILIVEDSDDDTQLILREIRKGGYSVTYRRVESAQAMMTELEQEGWDIILSDYVLPQFSGLDALKIFQEKNIDIPFLIVSGKIGEDVAVEAMRLGAHDYILKNNLTRLVPAIKRELHEAITRKKQRATDNALHDIQEQLSGILDSLDLVVWSYDTEKKCLTHVSSGIENFFGESAHNFLKSPSLWKKLVHQEDISPIELFRDHFQNGQPQVNEFRVILPGEKMKWLEQHMIPVLEKEHLKKINGVILDITKRKHYEEQIKSQAYYDPLTKLPNRILLSDRFKMATSLAKRKHSSLAILFVDIDRFKNINDTLGHKRGDLLIREIATRLKRGLREIDTVSRHGGDEFIILLPDMTVAGVEDVATRLLSIIDSPFYLDGFECYITCSIGISLFPINGKDLTTLIQCADQAMYRAKDLGKNMFQFYNVDMNDDFKRRSLIERELHWAMERGQIKLYYQPQVDINSLRLTGLEALCRWYHPKMGWIEPKEFIPIAEESGLIRSLGEWIIRTACEQMKKWQLAGIPSVRMAVNLTGKQFTKNNIAKTVLDILQETELSPEFLELEITESMAMNIDYTIAVLNELKNIGVRIAIDDFGTGYSSLNYLKMFPINTLKIDQSFVSDLGKDCHDTSIVKTIISIAHIMNLNVVAEGVETQEQIEILKTHGCHLAQGYYFSKPLPSDECTNLLKNHTSFGN